MRRFAFLALTVLAGSVLVGTPAQRNAVEWTQEPDKVPTGVRYQVADVAHGLKFHENAAGALAQALA